MIKITLNDNSTVAVTPLYETSNFIIHEPINCKDTKYVVALNHDKKPIVVRLNNIKVAKKLVRFLESYDLGILYSDIAITRDKEAVGKFKLLLIDFLHDTRSPFIIGNIKYNQ